MYPRALDVFDAPSAPSLDGGVLPLQIDDHRLCHQNSDPGSLSSRLPQLLRMLCCFQSVRRLDQSVQSSRPPMVEMLRGGSREPSIFHGGTLSATATTVHNLRCSPGAKVHRPGWHPDASSIATVPGLAEPVWHVIDPFHPSLMIHDHQARDCNRLLCGTVVVSDGKPDTGSAL